MASAIKIVHNESGYFYKDGAVSVFCALQKRRRSLQLSSHAAAPIARIACYMQRKYGQSHAATFTLGQSVSFMSAAKYLHRL